MILKGSYSENYELDNNNNDKIKGNKKEHKISSTLKGLIQKDEEYHNLPYYQRHGPDFNSKVGVIAMDSPYVSKESILRFEEKESRKKDISDKKFTSVLPKYPQNKDGLDTTPFGNIEGYRFRADDDKEKWIYKRGFVAPVPYRVHSAAH